MSSQTREKQMSNLTNTSYGMSTTLECGFGEAIERVKQAFAAQGFGTLTEIDVKATLMQKVGKEIEPYTILGTCNPELAVRAIAVEHEIGLLMPCNVLVHQHGN